MRPQGSPRLIEYARQVAYQDDLREAIRLQALANEMRDVFDDWPLSQRDFEAMAQLAAMLEARARGLMESNHGD